MPPAKPSPAAAQVLGNAVLAAEHASMKREVEQLRAKNTELSKLLRDIQPVLMDVGKGVGSRCCGEKYCGKCQSCRAMDLVVRIIKARGEGGE